MTAVANSAVQVLACSGRIDATTAPLLDEQLRVLHSAGVVSITLDLAAVSYLSSSGLRVMLLAQRRQQALGGRLCLRSVPERVLEVLRMAGFDRVFEFTSKPCVSPARDVGL